MSHVVPLVLVSPMLTLAASPGVQSCGSCHPKESAGFAKSAMARSLRLVADSEPEGSFEHGASGSHFESHDTHPGVVQSVRRGGEQASVTITYVVGSGSHADGYLALVGDHLFQSPISYYTKRAQWDVAPGYENARTPDFTRPVTTECLLCHSDKPRPIAGTLNQYQSPPFAGLAIQCDRCHGDPDQHLKRPVPGSIVNPSKLDPAARDSICEQCHLAGEVRIPNPGKSLADFHPGQKLEDVFTVYVRTRGSDPSVDKQVRVISQAEQLAISACARNSGGRLWCGTCHDPHAVPERPADYFREKCLQCHGGLAAAHIAPDRDCIGCHMPQRPAKDGGHTAFTDHRIVRHPEPDTGQAVKSGLVAWREADVSLRARNLALALVTAGLEKGDADDVIRGYRMLNRLEPQFADDPDVESALGNVLLKGKQPAEAERRFARALESRPVYAPYQVNLAVALLDVGKTAEGQSHLEKAVQLDPLLQQAVELLARLYQSEGNDGKADDLLSRYRTAMGIRIDGAK